MEEQGAGKWGELVFKGDKEFQFGRMGRADGCTAL
jgi:hypothetical protein